MNVEKSIDSLSPWITKIRINNKEYGGDYDAYNDRRVDFFIEKFRNETLTDNFSVLECGCLEGGHTVKIASEFPKAQIHAVDARDSNLAKAKLHTGLFNLDNVKFDQVDLETEEKVFENKYSVIFCVGLLYHLRYPEIFLRKCATSSDKLWLSTVISSEKEAEHLEENDLYRGKIYNEPVEHPLSGVRPKSFFPSLGTLCNMIWDAGFQKIEVYEQTLTPNGNGPAVLISTSKSRLD